MDYAARVKAQIQQFSDSNLRWKVPEVHKHWMRTYVFPKVKQVFECRDHITFYADCVKSKSAPVILSVGSGDGVLETAIAKNLIADGCSDFKIVLTELSPIRQERARQRAVAEGLSDNILFEIVDFNETFPEGKFDLIIAHHTLHHIVELELLFGHIREALQPDGVFASIDMIGRNGHMCWPETQSYVDLYWGFLPDRMKHNFQFNQFHEKFVNFDCSKSGFEGIRAQDILPLLVKDFWFEGFVGVGGIIDPLFERGYGQSFDMKNEKDLALADFLATVNEQLVLSGKVTPTMMFARMRPEMTPGKETNQFEHLSPEFCIHPVELPDAAARKAMIQE